MKLHASAHSNWIVIEVSPWRLVNGVISVDTDTKIMERYKMDANGVLARSVWGGPVVEEVALAEARADATRMIVYVRFATDPHALRTAQTHRALGQHLSSDA